MKIGYIKIDKDAPLKDEKVKNQLGVEKIFSDKDGETRGLAEALEYARFGDVLIVQDVHEISDDVEEFIRWCVRLHVRGITLVCVHQGIDTSGGEWHFVLESLVRQSAFPLENIPDMAEYCGKTRFYEELDSYFVRVENGELTVKEVCKRMKIGKSTYYRRWRTHGPHVKSGCDDGEQG